MGILHTNISMTLPPGFLLGELGSLEKLWIYFLGEFRLAQEAGRAVLVSSSMVKFRRGSPTRQQNPDSRFSLKTLKLGFSGWRHNLCIVLPYPRPQSSLFCGIPQAWDTLPWEAEKAELGSLLAW